MTTKGKFVLVEGPDGSGKSTLVEGLVARAIEQGVAACRMGFPRRVGPGKLIRDAFDGAPLAAKSMLWLLIADALDAEEEIETKLDAGMWVFADRHPMVSMRVYQRTLWSPAAITRVLDIANFRIPDRCIFLELNAQTALTRREARGEARNTFFEPEEVVGQERLNALYREIAGQLADTWRLIPGELFAVDANRSALEVLGDVYAKLGLP